MSIVSVGNGAVNQLQQDVVVILTVNAANVTAVTYNGSAASYSVVDGSTLHVDMPGGLATGTYDLVVSIGGTNYTKAVPYARTHDLAAVSGSFAPDSLWAQILYVGAVYFKVAPLPLGATFNSPHTAWTTENAALPIAEVITGTGTLSAEILTSTATVVGRTYVANYTTGVNPYAATAKLTTVAADGRYPGLPFGVKAIQASEQVTITDLAVDSISESSAYLTFTPVPGATQYLFQYTSGTAWGNDTYVTAATASGGGFIINGLQPSRTYQFRVFVDGVVSNIVSGLTSGTGTATPGGITPASRIRPSDISGTAYWVSIDGNDNNPGTQALPFRTINKGVSRAKLPGDGVFVGPGFYREHAWDYDFNGSNRQYEYIFNDGVPVAVGMKYSGTPSAPIVLAAAPGAEESVWLDCERDPTDIVNSSTKRRNRIGIQLFNSSNVIIDGINIVEAFTCGIVSWGHIRNNSGVDYLVLPSFASSNVVIQNCRVNDTLGPPGSNVSGIAPWGSRNWIIRNCIIDGSEEVTGRNASLIQAYGAVNILIEHVTGVNAAQGIQWKDHFYADEQKNFAQESEVRYCRFYTRDHGMSCTVRAVGSNAAGNNYIHHNIFAGYANNGDRAEASTGIWMNMRAANGKSGNLRIEHNIFAPHPNASSSGIFVDAANDLKLKGNIFVDVKETYFLNGESPTKKPRISQAEKNIFVKRTFKAQTGRYNTGLDKFYNSLSDWRAATTSTDTQLTVNNPDTTSTEIAGTAALFVDLADYKHAPNSPALGFMADGTNAGCYQLGTERIGA